MPIPIIDLFAGPGGLGEGFSALRRNGRPVFKIGLSIEKDPVAHQTLELRAFYRQFPDGKVPADYYHYLVGPDPTARQALFDTFPDEAHAARDEAWNATLGKNGPDEVSARINAALNGCCNWLLIGGPPCQAYSLVGRSKMIGEIGRKKFEEDPRHFLYREYLRIIADHQPRVFVMENVKGLLSARVGNDAIFQRILDDLRRPVAATHGPRHADAALGYRLVSVSRPPSELFGAFDPSDFIVQAEKHGVPQARHRLIIVGIREDVRANPGRLGEQPAVAMLDAIRDLPPLRSGLSKETDSAARWLQVLRDIPETTWFKTRQVDDETRRTMRAAIAELDARLDRGAEYVGHGRPVRPVIHPDWYGDPYLTGVCNHSTRAHIRADLHRYFFLAAYARVHGRSPVLENFPKGLLPRHRNVREAIHASKFNDRFRVQVADKPATTIVSHIAKDGHYFVHPDPVQCRSLTVREAARLQTFPDNYFFEGPRTEQYHQVGNAVPPLLAHQIAGLVARLFQP